MIQLTELHSYSCPNQNSDGKESARNAGDPGSIPALGRSPGKGNGNPPVFFPGKSQGQRILAGCSPWGHKESDMTEGLTQLSKLEKPLGSVFPPFSSYPLLISHVPNYDMLLFSLCPIFKILFPSWYLENFYLLSKIEQIIQFLKLCHSPPGTFSCSFPCTGISSTLYCMIFNTSSPTRLRIPQEQRSRFSYLCINNTKMEKHGTQ